MAVWPRVDLRAVTGHPIASSSFIGGACRERHVLPAPTADQAPSPAADQRSDLTKRGRARDPSDLRSPKRRRAPSQAPWPAYVRGDPSLCVAAGSALDGPSNTLVEALSKTQNLSISL